MEAVLLALAVFSATVDEPGDYECSLECEGQNRSYLLHVPPCFDGSKRLPVVIVFHGMSANAKLIKKLTHLDETADKHGFLVVYPSGTGFGLRKGFNCGGCLSDFVERDADDVAFTKAILDDLVATACADPRRVYATGLSNGAMMCYRLAAEIPDRITAIAPVSGTLATDIGRPRCPVSVLHFHGTCDNVLPFHGPNPEKRNFYDFLSVPETIRLFAGAAGCSQAPVVTQCPDVDPDDETTVRVHRYGDCQPGIDVVLVEIVGGGHQWPQHALPFRYLGDATNDIDANEMMWQFFCQHSK